MGRRIVLALIGLALCVIPGGRVHRAEAARAVPSVLRPCSLPSVPRPALCGSMAVPEDRTTPHGRLLNLRVAIVAASRSPARRDPLVVLLGGPGESAVADAATYASWLGPLLGDRDLLLVDERGAGGSGALSCPLLPDGDERAALHCPSSEHLAQLAV